MRQINVEKIIKFPLYRFTKKKWANSFFGTGQLRLGTLFDYAMNEKYGDAVHDRHEGYYVWRLPKAKWTNGVPEVRFIVARNNLLLCSSTDYDESYYKEFDANCCIRIDSMEFFTAIDEAMKKEFTPLLLRKVTYYDKSRWDCTPDYEDFAGVMKDIRFSPQKEVRALWEPQKLPLDYKSLEFEPGYFNNLKNPLIDVSEGEWYKKRMKKESKWLKPKTIFVPEAIKHCTLIQKPKT
jgi:hypothetical protein